MDALVRAAPPPGSAQAGDLYVDLQSRTLWLGVDPAVDPAAFVLISDIVALQAEIDGALVEAKAYTDAQILTRAPTVHTHSAAQITDFTAAVQAVIASTPGSGINPGMIAMFSGTLAEIGIGPWAGWALCDGSNGTPDLRDKFVLGAGHKVVGAVNPNDRLDTEGGGTHTHTISDTAISIAQMPQHAHGGVTGYVSGDHQHLINAHVTDAGGNHVHGIATNNNTSAGGAGVRGGNTGSANVSQNTEYGGTHQHSVPAAWSGGINANHNHSIAVSGSSQPHGHTIVGGGGVHEHWAWSTSLRDAIPFYALAYIMKL